MLRSISSALLGLALVASLAAQGFGRFGYEESVQVPNFCVDREGFRVDFPRADKIRFENPSQVWSVVQTSEYGQTVVLSGIGRSPGKWRSNLFGAGIEFHFAFGMGLTVGSTAAPFLTWTEGSVGPNVPTPPSRWILMSFRDDQPPVLFAFQGEPQALRLTGRPGQWVLRSEKAFAGWVRVSAPIGPVGFPTNTASALGRLVQTVRPATENLSQPKPNLVSVDIREDLQSVTATWRFDRAGAVVPPAAVLAPMGGYPMRVTTPVRRLPGFDADGPTTVSQTPTITMVFPTRRIPTGRFVAVGPAPDNLPASAATTDIPSLVELALANYVGSRDRVIREAAEKTVAEYLSEAEYEVEPRTGQRLPYRKDGTGIDLAAAQALLMQSTISTQRATSDPNALLTSVILRRDWATWRLWVADSDVGRRAGALAALAAAVCPEPERRLDGAMLQAGLAAERGLIAWRARNNLDPQRRPLLEVMEPLRRAIFSMEGGDTSGREFLQSLVSDLRVYGDWAVTLESTDVGSVFTWQAPDDRRTVIILASAFPLEFSAKENVAALSVADALGFTVIRANAEKAGPARLLFQPPAWAPPLPKKAALPRYSEESR